MSTETALPLETFRDIMSFLPWHFWQLANAEIPIDGGCNSLVREYSWQFRGAVGRSEIRQAIATAEQRLVENLGFSIAPHWVTETHYLEPYDHSWSSYNYANKYAEGLTLNEGKLKQIAQMSWELVEQVGISVSDADGDGINDTFSATIPMPTGVALSDLAIFFLPDDRVENKEFIDWQVRPVTLKQNGNNLEIIGKSWLVVKPTRYEGYWYKVGYTPPEGGDSSGAINPANSDNYVSSVGLYKRVVTNTNKAKLFYDNCGTLNSVDICATPANKETGLVQLELSRSTPCDCGSLSFPGYSPVPRYVEITYEAGEELKKWQVIIARLAAAELQRRVCGCDEANQELYNWMADSADPDSKFKPPAEELTSPLGNKRGAIYAWRNVKNLGIVRGYQP